MKNKTFILVVILILAVLIITISCATGKKAYVASENEELYGTWVNKDYNNSNHPAKHILNADGTFKLYTADYSTRVYQEGKFTITDKWSDSVDNIWYKFIITEWVAGSIKSTEPIYFLTKISNSGKILETVKSGIDYPTELSPDVLLSTYNILYRQ